MSHKSVDNVDIEVEKSDSDSDDDEPKQPKTTKVVKPSNAELKPKAKQDAKLEPKANRLTITRKKVKDLSEAERNQLIFVRR